MLRKIWIVAALAVIGVALTPDTAEAARRRWRRRNYQPVITHPAPMIGAPVVTPPTPGVPVTPQSVPVTPQSVPVAPMPSK